MNTPQPILWEGHLVGYIGDPKVDMFDLYGTWVPCPCKELEQFLARLEAEEQLWVTLGTQEPLAWATIEEVPADQVNLKSRLSGPSD